MCAKLFRSVHTTRGSDYNSRLIRRQKIFLNIPVHVKYKVAYRSVPFDTIEDINGKFVGLNGTLNGKKDNERTIEHLKYRSVPFNTVQYHSASLRMLTVNVLVSMVI